MKKQKFGVKNGLKTIFGCKNPFGTPNLLMSDNLYGKYFLSQKNSKFAPNVCYKKIGVI